MSMRCAYIAICWTLLLHVSHHLYITNLQISRLYIVLHLCTKTIFQLTFKLRHLQLKWNVLFNLTPAGGFHICFALLTCVNVML